MKTKFYSNDFSCEMERDGMAIHGIIINGYKATAPSEPHDGVYIKPRGSNMPKQLVIPGEIKNLPVIAIGNYAFAKERLTDIIIPDSVKTIGSGAFEDNQLTNIVIPDSVEIIHYQAFCGNKLTDVVIPDSVKTINTAAFAYNSLTGVDDFLIVNGYIYIYKADNKPKDTESPFSIMTYKNEITITGYKYDARYIPGSAIIIGCPLCSNNVKDLVIPGEINGLPVVAIGDSAFEKSKIASVVIPDSVKTIGGSAFAENQLTNVVIPDSIRTIKNYAFEKNQLRRVIIPDSVERMGDCAFVDNPLTEFVVPESVKRVSFFIIGD